MAYYDALVAAWNGSPSPPAGVTGQTLVGQTTANKLARINAWTVPTGAKQITLPPSQILNAIVPADLAALTTAQVSLLTLLLSGAAVDVSVGTTVRAAIRTIFAGKTTTLNQLAALVAGADAPTQLWWKANGYASPIDSNDLVAAGGLS